MNKAMFCIKGRFVSIYGPFPATIPAGMPYKKQLCFQLPLDWPFINAIFIRITESVVSMPLQIWSTVFLASLAVSFRTKKQVNQKEKSAGNYLLQKTYIRTSQE